MNKNVERTAIDTSICSLTLRVGKKIKLHCETSALQLPSRNAFSNILYETQVIKMLDNYATWLNPNFFGEDVKLKYLWARAKKSSELQNPAKAIQEEKN